MLCEMCGSPVERTTVLCPVCGARPFGDAPAAPEAEEPAPSKPVEAGPSPIEVPASPAPPFQPILASPAAAPVPPVLRDGALACGACGTTLGPMDRFCPDCGEEVGEHPVSPPAASAVPAVAAAAVPAPRPQPARVCATCGEEVDEDAPACWACGGALATAPEPTPAFLRSTASAATARSPEPVPAPPAPPPAQFSFKPIRSAPPADDSPAPSQAAASSASRAPLVLGGVAVVAVVGIILAVFLLSAKRGVLNEIGRGNLVKPEGSSAYDLFLKWSRGGRSASDVAEIAARAMPALDARGGEILRRLHDENLESEAEWAEAIRIFTWMNELRPDPATESRLYFSQGRLKFIRGENNTALLDYQRAMDLDSGWAMPANGLARCYVRMQDRTAAQQQYRRTVDIEPTWIYPWLNLAAVSWELKDYATTAWAARRAASLDPTKASAHYYVALAIEQQRDLCGALAEYQLALDNAYRSASPGFSVDVVRRRIERLAPKCR